MTFSEKLRAGEIVAVGNKLYGLCEMCGNIVQINKFLFGSLHVCAKQSDPADPKKTGG